MFDQADKCYGAGEVVTGLVTVELKEEKKVKKVKLKLKGRCEVRYTELHNNDGNMEVVKRKSKEKNVEYKMKVFDGDYLHSGESSFPLTFTLPLTLLLLM